MSVLSFGPEGSMRQKVACVVKLNDRGPPFEGGMSFNVACDIKANNRFPYRDAAVLCAF